METTTSFEGLIQAMRSKLGEQTIAIRELAIAIAESETQIGQRDQVTRLGILRSRIMSEVKDIERTESAAQSRAVMKTLFCDAPVAFTFSSLFLDAFGLKNAPQIGAHLMLSTLAKKDPFGTILIAIGLEGIPKDVNAMAISCLARESNRSESDVKTSLKQAGHLLLTPEQFTDLLDKMESGILDGSYSLPLTFNELRSLTT